MRDRFLELGESEEEGGATKTKLRNKQRGHLFD